MKPLNFKNFFSKMKPTRRREFRSISEKAHFDWRLILICFFVATVLSVAGSVYIFIQVSRGEIFEVVPSDINSKVTIDIELLKSEVETFDGRKSFIENLSNMDIPLDPSI
jgi:membrane associated rhomboid family serine protease